jgi:hypothetical protein
MNLNQRPCRDLGVSFDCQAEDRFPWSLHSAKCQAANECALSQQTNEQNGPDRQKGCGGKLRQKQVTGH